MKDPREVLVKKLDELKKVQAEVSALRTIMPLLVDDSDKPLESKPSEPNGQTAKSWP